MDPAQARDVICSSLGITDLYEAFQDINLEKPLGSATIAQVGMLPHAVAYMRGVHPSCLSHHAVGKYVARQASLSNADPSLLVNPARSMCLADACTCWAGEQASHSKRRSPVCWVQVHKALLRREVDGIRDVAVKVQYPGALDTMLQDLANIRLAAEFLQVHCRLCHGALWPCMP